MTNRAIIYTINCLLNHKPKTRNEQKTAPHSPRRQKLNLRMKSLSLDSPESTELHSHIKRRYPPSGPVHFNIQGGSASLLDHNTPPSNSSRLHC